MSHFPKIRPRVGCEVESWKIRGSRQARGRIAENARARVGREVESRGNAGPRVGREVESWGNAAL